MACLGSSDFLINLQLNSNLRGSAFVIPPAQYVALCTGSVTSNMTGSTLPEVSTGGGSLYARQAITCNGANWTSPGAGVDSCSNNLVVTFPTAGTSWGTITFATLCDASGAGNLYYYGALTANQVVNTGNQLTFAASGLSVANS